MRHQSLRSRYPGGFAEPAQTQCLGLTLHKTKDYYLAAGHICAYPHCLLLVPAPEKIICLDSPISTPHTVPLIHQSSSVLKTDVHPKLFYNPSVPQKEELFAMVAPEQPADGNPNDGNNASNVLSFILGVVVPGCAVLTVVLIFIVWFMRDCFQPTGRTGESDDDGPRRQSPKYSGLPGRAQDQAPPAWREASRSQ